MSLKNVLMIGLMLTTLSAFGQKRPFKILNFVNKMESSAITMQIYRVDQSKITDSGISIRQKIDEKLPAWVSSPIIGRIQLKEEVNSFAFAYVLENKTDSNQYFFSNGHQILPTEKMVGVSLRCFCKHNIRYLKPKERFIFISKVTYDYPRFPNSKLDIVTQVIPVTVDYIKQNKLEGLIIE